MLTLPISGSQSTTKMKPKQLLKGGLTMNHLDFKPLYHSTVGFDRLISLLNATGKDTSPSYPPYNIERTGDSTYRITMAVAGFNADEISIETKEGALLVKGDASSKKKSEQDKSEFLHKGISTSPFERRFQLADYVEVRGADLRNGLLSIELVREIPESMKAKKIKIATSEPKVTQIEGSPAN